MDLHGFPTILSRFTQIAMDFQWFLIDFDVYSWISINFLWISTGFNGFALISHDFPWITMDFRCYVDARPRGMAIPFTTAMSNPKFHICVSMPYAMSMHDPKVWRSLSLQPWVTLKLIHVCRCIMLCRCTTLRYGDPFYYNHEQP